MSADATTSPAPTDSVAKMFTSTVFDHVSIPVADMDKSLKFYEAALAPLGISKKMGYDHPMGREVGMGKTKPDFWLSCHPSRSAAAIKGMHIAFASPDRKSVDAWYAAAIAAGGTDNGKPGLRPHYHPDYYGAFVKDPDGHEVEAVCHLKE
ncbi:lactoylglutathione lyase [Hyaloraphidium curvatum]|nr:lactoylglutathione lyase [Hyaloraphidium curvatum]